MSTVTFDQIKKEVSALTSHTQSKNLRVRLFSNTSSTYVFYFEPEKTAKSRRWAIERCLGCNKINSFEIVSEDGSSTRFVYGNSPSNAAALLALIVDFTLIVVALGLVIVHFQ